MSDADVADYIRRVAEQVEAAVQASSMDSTVHIPSLNDAVMCGRIIRELEKRGLQARAELGAWVAMLIVSIPKQIDEPIVVESSGVH